MHTIESLESRRLLAASFAYAAAFGDKETLDSGNAIAVDAGGNTYIGGTFRGKADVNKGNRATFFLTAHDNYDAFLVKYDPQGKLVWAYNFGAKGDELIDHVVVGPNGDVYASGTFEDVVDFDPKGPVHNLTSHGKHDAFILHLTSKGNFVWAGNIGGERDDAITALAVGPDGDMYYSGYARLSGDVDPTRTVRNIVDRGVDDTVIARLNGKTGKIKWLKVYGENPTRETVNGLSVDAKSNVYAAGTFNDVVEFDRNNRGFDREAEGGYDIYLARLNGKGKFQYIKTIGGNKDDLMVDMAQDAAGNFYITGNFEKDVDFDPGSGQTILEAPGDSAVYIAKFDAGANLQWAKVFGEEEGEHATITARGIAVAPNGDVYGVGDFADHVDFDPGIGLKVIDANKNGNTPALLTQVESSDAYVVQFSKDGDFVDVDHFGGEDGTALPHDVAIDSSGGIDITGAFAGYVDLNPTSGEFKRSTQEKRRDSNVFVVKLNA